MFDQRQFGCTLMDQNYIDQFIKKPTRLTDQEMALDVSRQCPGGHYHLPIEGTSPGIGSLAEAAAEYQPVLCSHFCQAIVKIFEYKGNNDYLCNDQQW